MIPVSLFRSHVLRCKKSILHQTLVKRIAFILKRNKRAHTIRDFYVVSQSPTDLLRIRARHWSFSINKERNHNRETNNIYFKSKQVCVGSTALIYRRYMIKKIKQWRFNTNLFSVTSLNLYNMGFSSHIFAPLQSPDFSNLLEHIWYTAHIFFC